MEKERIKHQLQSGESLVLLDRFDVRIDIKNDKKVLTIPCLEITDARVSNEVIDKNPILLEGGQ